MKNLLMLIFLFSSLNLLANKRYTFAPKKNPKEHKEEKEKFTDRLFFNGNVGLNVGDVTQIQISPGVGYKVNNKLGLGLGVSYIYSSDSRGTTKFSQSVFGPRAFGIYKFMPQFYFTTKYEFLKVKQKIGSVVSAKKDAPAWFLGLGFRTGSQGVGFSIEGLYDVLHDENKSLYSRAFVFQGGLSLGF